MAVLKYRGSGGTIQTLLDVTGTLARIGALETKTNNLQTTVNTLNASSGWKRLSKNCWYKKVGLWCTVQCDYISLSASTWKTLGTLPAGYRPVITGLTDKFKVVSGAAFHRGENNIGLIEIDGSGVVSMYATVASDYWSANSGCAAGAGERLGGQDGIVRAGDIGDMEIREALRRHLRLRGPADAHGQHREHIFGEHLLRRLRRRLVPQRAVHRSAGRSRDDSIGTSDRVGRDGLELEAVNVVNADGAPAVGRPGDEHIRHGLLPRGRSLEVALTFRAPPLLRFPETLGREREWRS